MSTSPNASAPFVLLSLALAALGAVSCHSAEPTTPAVGAAGAAGAGAGADAGSGAEAGAGSCQPAPVGIERDVGYVVRGDAASDALTRLDVYPPPGPICGRPIVIWVHGGGWSTGDKANQLEAKIPFFNGLGAVLVSIDYRLSAADNSVRHPDHVEDVAAAFAWVREHAAELGGAPDRVALLGHSAGAHLVALVATNPRFLAAHGLTAGDVRCVGSYDSEYTVSEIIARDERYEDVFTADPEAWTDASPSAQVRAGLPPFQLACRGTSGRVAQCEAFAEQLRAAGGEAQAIDASSLEHEEVNAVIGEPSDVVMTPRVREFLVRCGF
jgi:arylformamidase